MRLTLGPLHLLPFTKALANDLIDGRFDKARADPLASPVALAIVGNEVLVVLDVRVELLHVFEDVPGGVIATERHSSVEVHREGLHDLQGFIHIAMPQEPFELRQLPYDWARNG